MTAGVGSDKVWTVRCGACRERSWWRDGSSRADWLGYLALKFDSEGGSSLWFGPLGAPGRPVSSALFAKCRHRHDLRVGLETLQRLVERSQTSSTLYLPASGAK